jgi:hypothetical protein
MAKDKGDLLLSAEIGKPIPGKDAFNGNNDILAIGSNGLKEDLRLGLDIPMQEDLALLIEHT